MVDQTYKQDDVCFVNVIMLTKCCEHHMPCHFHFWAKWNFNRYKWIFLIMISCFLIQS